MRLNRRVPVGTHGGVRGRLSDYEDLLLDCVGFPHGGSCQWLRPLTDEGKACGNDPFLSSQIHLALIRPCGATFPRGGEGF